MAEAFSEDQTPTYFQLYTSSNDKTYLPPNFAPVYNCNGSEKRYTFNVPRDILCLPNFLRSNQQWNATVHNVHDQMDWWLLVHKVMQASGTPLPTRRRITAALASDLVKLYPNCNFFARSCQKMYPKEVSEGEAMQIEEEQEKMEQEEEEVEKEEEDFVSVTSGEGEQDEDDEDESS